MEAKWIQAIKKLYFHNTIQSIDALVKEMDCSTKTVQTLIRNNNEESKNYGFHVQENPLTLIVDDSVKFFIF